MKRYGFVSIKRGDCAVKRKRYCWVSKKDSLKRESENRRQAPRDRGRGLDGVPGERLRRREHVRRRGAPRGVEGDPLSLLQLQGGAVRRRPRTDDRRKRQPDLRRTVGRGRTQAAPAGVCAN